MVDFDIDRFQAEVIGQVADSLRGGGFAKWVDMVDFAHKRGDDQLVLASEKFDAKPDMLYAAIDYASRRGVALVVPPKPFRYPDD